MSSRLKLTATSPAQTFTEPLTIFDIKQFCEIPDADTTRDLLLGAYAKAAREVAELRQGRDLVLKQYDLTMDCLPCRIELREGAVSVDAFQYRDSAGDWTGIADYIFDADACLVMPPYGEMWPLFTPYPSSAVLLRYTVSPAQVDEQVLMGMRYLVSQWYHNRIPAEAASGQIQQYPYALGLLDHGRVERV